MKVQALRRQDFPSHPFFDHLQKGTGFYQNGNFGRAIEEWWAAGRLNIQDIQETAHLKAVDGRLFFGSLIEEVPLLFLLATIHLEKITGIGLIKSDLGSMKFTFKNGMAIFAATTRKERRIGNFVLLSKALSPEKLEPLVDDARMRNMKLGKYLVKRQIISSKMLQDVLTLQVQEIFSDSLFLRKGHFYFREGAISEETIVKYSPLRAALIAARRGFRFARFLGEIPSNTIVFRVSPYLREDQEKILEKLDANEKFIFSLIDGVRNIDQLRKFSGTDEVSLMNILYRLNAKGLIRKTKEVGVQEDKEFQEISELLHTFLDIYRLITIELFHEMGNRGKEIVAKSRSSLRPGHREVFRDVNLEEPDKLIIDSFLRNMSSYFPAPEQRALFLDAFYELFVNILDELVKFFGADFTKNAVQKIERIGTDLAAFSVETPMKKRAVEVLGSIIKKYS